MAGLRPPWRSRDVSAGSRRSRSPLVGCVAPHHEVADPRRPGKLVPGGLEAVAKLLRERVDLERGHGRPTLPPPSPQPCAVRCARAHRLGFVWTSPNTLLGLLLGLFTFQAPRAARPGGVRSTPAGVVADAPARWTMTVGFVIVSAALEGRLLAHERHHVRQYMVWGPLFIPITSRWRPRSATAAIRWRSPPSSRRTVAGSR